MNIYDFDGTIYNGDSTIDFYWHCIKRYPAVALHLFPALYGLLLYLFDIADKTALKQLFYRFLKAIPDCDGEISIFWDKHEGKIKEWYLNRKQTEDIIISASPEFLLKPICDKLNVRLIASKVDKHTGVYVGKNCHGEEKVRRFNEELICTEIQEFYSDSESDAPLATVAEKAFWVNGDEIVPWNERSINLTSKIKATFFTQKFFLFVFCGGCGTLANFFLSLLFSRKIDPTLAYVGGYAASSLLTYSLNTYLTFKQPFSLVRYAKFLVSYIPNFLILFTMVAAMINVFYLPEVFAYLSAAVLGLPVTFVIVKIFAFKEKSEGENKNG